MQEPRHLSANVVITGVATPTGLAVALAFAERGCNAIYLGDSNLEVLQNSQDDIVTKYPSVQVHVADFDRSDEGAVDKFFAKVSQTFPSIDVAVNIVSQTHDQDVPTQLSTDGFDRNFRVYQRGAFLIQRALLRQMVTQDIKADSDTRGSIVNVVDHGPTPSLAEIPIVAAVAYAIIGFSRTDACDYAADKIRVNCVAASEVMVEKTKPELPGGVPLPRKGVPADVANAVTWLSSPGSGWLTGQVVSVDGGRGLHHWW